MFKIRKVGVLGSGVMGSTIACHLANAGLEVLMLDILPKDESADRNSVAATALKNAVKSKPAPLYRKSFVNRITVGNFEDDMPKITDCDWIIEVVVERLYIKNMIFSQVDEYRKTGSIVTSNTSGIPIGMMLDERSDDFKRHFLGTHFFNPPRYLPLLEIIPTGDTDPKVVSFMMHFGQRILGKNAVLCKDTPAFIGNRVGVYAMSLVFQLASELGLTIQDVDKLTGPALCRPKTGTFRLADLVGLDTAHKVINGMRDHCPDDGQVQQLAMPDYFTFLIENQWFGNKSGQGFYKKTGEKDAQGKRIVHGLNLATKEYEAPQKSQLASLGVSKQIENDEQRIKALFKHEDAGGQLIRKSLAGLFAYVSKRIPEIADALYSIDDALRSGFAWDFGPFEYWEVVGIEEGIQAALEEGYTVAPWVQAMLNAGHTSFYRVDNGLKQYYDVTSGSYKTLPGSAENIILKNLAAEREVYKNDEVRVYDIGDQVLCLEFTSKANAIGEGILRGINEAITIAEEGDWRGLVLGNNDKNFTVGANLMLLAMFAFEEEWDDLAMAIELFQNTSMRCRYSSVPIVAATQGFVFGGGCEIAMHCDSVIAASESYIGLVEVGVGILPGGAGTKEFALRASDSFFEGDVQIPTLVNRFRTIATATVATSAYEAFDHGYLNGKDHVQINPSRRLFDARNKVVALSDGYLPPIERQDVQVLGRTGLAALYTAANELFRGNWATEHDIKIARKVAYVLCGGDLSEGQKVSEKYLLELEKEAVLQLMGESKTQERVQHMLQYRKPLRN